MAPPYAVHLLERIPQEPSSDLANAGIYLARQSVLEQIPPGPRLVDFGHHVLPRLIGRMYGYRIREYFVDIGTPAALARAEADWAGLSLDALADSGSVEEGGVPE